MTITAANVYLDVGITLALDGAAVLDCPGHYGSSEHGVPLRVTTGSGVGAMKTNPKSQRLTGRGEAKRDSNLRLPA